MKTKLPLSPFTNFADAILLVMVFLHAGTASVVAGSTTPDFGPNVFILDPSMGNKIKEIIDPITNKQKDEESAQFNEGRFALLFKPGTYTVDVGMGFYMQALGLGQMPDNVVFTGPGPHSARWGNVTTTFWRAVENLEISSGEYYWGVSQGTELRRVHATGSLALSSGGWASGGFIADCKIDGRVNSYSQQQWISRNCILGGWSNAVWNMVFVGTPKIPADWPHYTFVDNAPAIAEKPYLYIDNNEDYFVMVPGLQKNCQGITWASPTPPVAGKSIPISQFYLAHAGKDTAATINAALVAGKNLILTPGIYRLETAILVTRPDTIVLGLGYATLIPTKGTPAMIVSDVDGVRVGGILFEAGTTNSSSLLQVGSPGSTLQHAGNPTILHDIFCRVGGTGPASADSMVTINSNDVIGDNAWLWRADHGAGANWSDAKNKNGLVVNGNNVIYNGLSVEHTQQYQTLWNGDGGRVYFYQSEIPYDVPGQSAWRPGSAAGYASYKVGDNVKTHEAWGLGVYCLFNDGPAILQNAYETPTAPGIKMHHLVSIRLGGKAAGDTGIAHIINGTGGSAVGNKFIETNLAEWP